METKLTITVVLELPKDRNEEQFKENIFNHIKRQTFHLTHVVNVIREKDKK